MSRAGSSGSVQESLLRSASAFGEKTAVADAESRVTYDALLDRALHLAHGLQDLGLGDGDRVAVVMPNGIDCTVAIYAALLAGGVFVVLSPDTKADQLATILADSGASFVVAHRGAAGEVAEAVDRVSRAPIVIFDGDTGDPDALTIAAVSTGHAAPRDRAVVPDDVAGLIYTSGTTGRPKGVMMTHGNLTYLAETIGRYLRLAPDDRILSVLSLGHTYGLSQLLVSVDLGATLHLERSFVYLAQATRAIAAESITVIPGVPTVFAMLLSMHRKEPLEFPSVQRVTCAGGALLPSFVEGLREVFPNALIFPMYGLTECMRVCYLEPELVASKPASVGRPIAGSQAWVLDEHGQPVPPGEAGVLHVSGPHVMPGYWNDERLTAEMLVAGPVPGQRLLRTGDHFRTDEDGLLYFVGRSDEIIKTRGEKVSPVEVENVLHGIDGIHEAAVIGVPDELLGEAVRGYVTLDEGSALTEREILLACRQHLEGFKVPKEIVVLDELPKTATGKIRKASLRDSAGV